jgi:hypothetical protein
MTKKDLMFISMALGVIGLFVFLSVIGRTPKALTARAEHATFTKDTPRETCLACHAPESAVAPMPAHHPKKGRPPDKTTPCFACHKMPTAATPALLLNRVPADDRGFILWLSRQQR